MPPILITGANRGIGLELPEYYGMTDMMAIRANHF